MSNGMIHEAAYIHPNAVVHDDVEIGAGTAVWQFASIIRGSRIGANCIIANGAIVDASSIGDRSIVCSNAVIDPGMMLGAEVFIGPGVKLTNDRWPSVWKGADYNYDRLLRQEAVTILIDDGASIGANAVVLAGVVIGTRAMVAAGAVVSSNLPAWHMLRRDGTVVAIDVNRPKHRLREAIP